MAHVLLVVHLRRGVLVSVGTELGALLGDFLHALHLVAVCVLLLVIVHSHLAVCRSFLSFVSHHAVLVAVRLPVVLLVIAHPRWHLVVMRLVDHGVVVGLPFALAEAALIFGM